MFYNIFNLIKAVFVLKIKEMCVNLHGILDKSKRMRQRNALYVMLMAVVAFMTSCKSSDDYDIILYNDAAITSFTLGTVTRESGSESTTYAGSLYAFTIDPNTHTIENTDSLPIGSVVNSITCSLSTLNNGVPTIKNLTDDNFTWFTSGSAVDFSQERIFRIVPSNGQGYTDYTVKVNVHKEDGDEYVWHLQPNAEMPSEDLPAGIKQWLGESSYEEYGISTDGKLVARHKDATEWLQDISDTDEDIAHLPKENLALVSYPLAYTDSTDYVILAGWVDDETTAVWRKIVDNHEKDPMGSWVYMEPDDTDKYTLLNLTHLRLFYYDGVVIAIGGDYQKSYESRDNGITWKETKRFLFPSDFDHTATKVDVKVDEDNYVWLYCSFNDGSHKIWKGRLNRLGWKK